MSLPCHICWLGLIRKNNPEKEQKPKKSTIENKMAQQSATPHGEYPGYQCECGWKPKYSDLEDLEEKVEDEMAQMEDDKNLMINMRSVTGVNVTVSITCPKCDEDVENTVEADADIMWESDPPDHRPPHIEGYDMVAYRVLEPAELVGSRKLRDVMDAAFDALEGIRISISPTMFWKSQVKLIWILYAKQK